VPLFAAHDVTGLCATVFKPLKTKMTARTRVVLGTCVFESDAAITVRPVAVPLPCQCAVAAYLQDEPRYSYMLGSTDEDAAPLRFNPIVLKRDDLYEMAGRAVIDHVMCLSAKGLMFVEGAQYEFPGGIKFPANVPRVPTDVPRETGSARVVYEGSLVVESLGALRVNSLFSDPLPTDMWTRRTLFDVGYYSTECVHVRGHMSIDLEGAPEPSTVWQAIVHDRGTLTVEAGCVEFKYGVLCGRGSSGITCAPGAEVRVPCLLSSDRLDSEQDCVVDFAGGAAVSTGMHGKAGARTLCPRAPAFVPASTHDLGLDYGQDFGPDPVPDFGQSRVDEKDEGDEEDEEDEGDESGEQDVGALTVAHVEESLAQSEEDYVRACALWARHLSARMDKHLAHCSLRRELRAYDADTDSAACAAAALEVLEKEIHELDAALEYYRMGREEAHDEMVLDESILAAVRNETE
jgi:hypothetical protein